MKDIMSIFLEAGTFRMFVSAIQATELVDTLRSVGPFTVFAPDDEAFAKIPKDEYRQFSKEHATVKGSSNVSHSCWKIYN